MSRANTNRFRRSRIGNGRVEWNDTNKDLCLFTVCLILGENGNGSSTQNSAYGGEENKGLGISAIGNGGIRNGMAGMNLGSANPENDRSSNHTRTSSSPGSVSRMMSRRTTNRRI
jgi:hypothetical protein